MQVRVRQRTSFATCGHVVKSGEKYLKVFTVSDAFSAYSTYCSKCAHKRMTAKLQEALAELRS
jgi:hypothetical protein